MKKSSVWNATGTFETSPDDSGMANEKPAEDYEFANRNKKENLGY